MEKEYLRQIILDHLSEFEGGKESIKRSVNLEPHLKSSDISVITGVRRCGKSTLLKQISLEYPESKIFYLDLESPRLSTFQLEDFDLCDQIWQEMIAQDRRYDGKANAQRPHANVLLLLDEVQNVEGWEKWVRYFSEKRNFKVFITGSNSEMLSSELASVLGGRYITLELFPFSVEEIARHQLGSIEKLKRNTDLLSQLNAIVQNGFEHGMFPKPYIEKSSQIYPHLLNDIVSRDIVKRKKIRKPLPLLELANLLAQDNSRLLNINTTSQLIGLEDARTSSKYIGYFEEAYLFFRLRRFSSSLRKQMRGLCKTYCIDPVMSDLVSAKAARLTAALENMVFLELHKQKLNFGYWISSNGYEVDFIVGDAKGNLTALQVCYDLSSPETLKRELRALEAAGKEMGIKNKVVITRYPSTTQKYSALLKDIRVKSFLGFLELWGE